MCSMNEHVEPDHFSESRNEEAFQLLSELHNSPNLTQKQLFKSLDMSLGKARFANLRFEI